MPTAPDNSVSARRRTIAAARNDVVFCAIEVPSPPVAASPYTATPDGRQK
jgi:hypothetical protein